MPHTDDIIQDLRTAVDALRLAGEQAAALPPIATGPTMRDVRARARMAAYAAAAATRNRWGR